MKTGEVKRLCHAANEKSGLPGREVRVLKQMIIVAKPPRWQCYLSVSSLARGMSQSARTVKLATKGLRERGLITPAADAAKHPGKPVTYDLIVANILSLHPVRGGEWTAQWQEFANSDVGNHCPTRGQPLPHTWATIAHPNDTLTENYTEYIYSLGDVLLSQTITDRLLSFAEKRFVIDPDRLFFEFELFRNCCLGDGVDPETAHDWCHRWRRWLTRDYAVRRGNVPFPAFPHPSDLATPATWEDDIRSDIYAADKMMPALRIPAHD